MKDSNTNTDRTTPSEPQVSEPQVVGVHVIVEPQDPLARMLLEINVWATWPLDVEMPEDERFAPYERVDALLRQVNERVRWHRRVRAECEDLFQSSVGRFPLLPALSDQAAVAVYISILAKRGCIDPRRIRWPDALTDGDRATLQDPGSGLPDKPHDVFTAVMHYMPSRYAIAVSGAPATPMKTARKSKGRGQ